MTTIAYRNGEVAADRAMLQGGTKFEDVIDKIVRREDGAVAGAAGRAGYLGAFVRWFMTGSADAPPEAKAAADLYDRGVIFMPGGIVRCYEDGTDYFEFTPEFYAFGSGRDHAVGAFYMGASAEQAVRAAGAFDPGTGAGDVLVLKVGPL